MRIETGYLLISREPHSCVVKFVENTDEKSVLLVDGKQDEYYTQEEFS